MDLARWTTYDRYIQVVQAEGMVTELWFFADDSEFGELPAEDRLRLIRYAMARTSAFAQTMYVIALEWQEDHTAQAVNQMGAYVQTVNPWRRLLSVHSLTLTGWNFAGRGWGTFIASQAGNDSTPDVVNADAIALREVDPIPHISEEFGFLEVPSDMRLRGNLWAAFLGGSAGTGTGSDIRALRQFLAQSAAPFHQMVPDNSIVEGGGSRRFALALPGQHYIVYSSGGAFWLNVSGANLTGYWFNPRDPSGTLGAPFPVTAGSSTFTPPSDVSSDWVLWITTNDATPVTATPMPTLTALAPPEATVEPTSALPPTLNPLPSATAIPTLEPPSIPTADVPIDVTPITVS
jgi:hypothetical protein